MPDNLSGMPPSASSLPRPRVCLLTLALCCLLTGGSRVLVTEGCSASAALVYPDKQNLLTYQDAKGRARPVKAPKDWSVRRGHILQAMQLVMGPLPDRVHNLPPLAIRVLEDQATTNFVRTKITFLSEKDDRVPAWLLIPARAHGKLPAMVCLHQTTPIGKDEPVGLGGNENLRYATELAERGYVTLAPDYPNFGEYKVDPYAAGYVSATMKGIWNHMRAVDLLQGLSQVDPERIGVIGHSLGGHNALFLAVFDSRIKAVVTSCGFNSFFYYAGGDLSGWSHQGYMPRIASVYQKDPNLMPFDFTEVLASIAPRAVFVSAPVEDTNFPVKGVHACEEAARPVYRLLDATSKLRVVHPAGGHDFPPDVRREAYQWLDAMMK